MDRTGVIDVSTTAFTNQYRRLYAIYNTFTGYHRCYSYDELCNDDNVDIFRNDYILPDTDISDEIAADSIYGILRILLSVKQIQHDLLQRRVNSDIYTIIKSVLKENIKTILII